MYWLPNKYKIQNGFLMSAECKQSVFEFQGLGSRKVVADFEAGDVSSDGMRPPFIQVMIVKADHWK